MFDPYTQNAFRVLGLAAEVDPALLPSWMEPRHLPPLWKITWLAEPDRSAHAVAEAMEALQTPDRLMAHYRTWFRKETPLDQRAFKAIEDGYWEGAADLWKGAAETGDEGALQNLAVLYHSRALSASGGTTPVWAYWTRALDWTSRLVLVAEQDPMCVELRERIVEDLVALAHEQASRNSAEDVRLVLDIFRRAGLPQKRREQLEEDLLSMELTRLEHGCNRIREALPSAFRVGDHLSERNVETFKKRLDEEIYPLLAWITRAQPGGHLEERARKEVALLLRSLSRAVRGKVEVGDLGFMARAVEIAPEGFHSELLEGNEAPTEVSKTPPPEYLEDTYATLPRDEDAVSPSRKRSVVIPLVAVLVVLLGMTLGGLFLLSERHRSEVAEQRRVLQEEYDRSINESARLAALHEELKKKVEKTRMALEKAPATEKERIQAKLDGLRAEQEKTARDHQAARAELAELKDKLAGVK